MHALKQTMKAPESRELRIHLPDEIAPNTTVEVILMYGEPQCAYEEKIEALKGAIEDQIFKQDLDDITGDFAAIDGEEWEF